MHLPEESGLATLSEIFRKYHGLMTAWAVRAGVPPQDAADVVQEAMLEVSRHGEFLSGLGEGQKLAWLRRTVTRKAIDARRYRLRSKRSEARTVPLSDLRRSRRDHPRVFEACCRGMAADEPLADDTSPSRRAANNEICESWLSRLAEDDRVACTLILGEILTPEQAAARLGITVEEVGIRVARGLKNLKGLLMRKAR